MPQVMKAKKCCGTCAYWMGAVALQDSNYVNVKSGFYDKCGCSCKMSPNRNLKLDFQKTCSKWAPYLSKGASQKGDKCQ